MGTNAILPSATGTLIPKSSQRFSYLLAKRKEKTGLHTARQDTISNVVVTDHWIIHPLGRIFSRVWSPDKQNLSPNTVPIILFHDSLGCIKLWKSFPSNLCRRSGRQVIAYDRLGFGKSDPRVEKLGMDFIAEEALMFFPTIQQELGFDRFVAFGHSVGGGIAVNCAAEFEKDCKALITESAQAFPEDLTLQGIRTSREHFKDEAHVKSLEKYHGEKARWVLGAWIDTWLHPDFASWSLAPVLPRVTCPVLAIHGEYDEYGSRRHPEMIATLSRGPSRYEIMPNTHHVPHREREEVVIGMIVDFLATVVT